MSLILVCDESGAKGYAVQDEQYPGEVGVMAGYLLTRQQLPAVRADLDAICLPFRQLDGKLHVTDLGPQAPVLRTTIHDYLRSHNIPIVFDAIHVQGFREHFRNNPDTGRESLHTAIALGIFTKAVAYSSDAGLQDSFVEVITDRVDPPLMDGFFRAFEEFMDDDPVVVMHQRRHPDPQQRTRTWFASQVSWPEGFDAESFEVAGYSIESDASNSGLTVAADVLAGDLVYFFRSRRGMTFCGPLAAEGVLDGYALADLCYGLTSPGGAPSVNDTMFRHPLHAARMEVQELLASGISPQSRARLTEMVRGRAYMIHLSHRGEKPGPKADWHQAREEFGIPAALWL
jgi:hypothetical protein